ncbi:MAG: hypothetical protein U0237_00190 [Thermoleophilia bacterium]
MRGRPPAAARARPGARHRRAPGRRPRRGARAPGGRAGGDLQLLDAPLERVEALGEGDDVPLGTDALGGLGLQAGGELQGAVVRLGDLRPHIADRRVRLLGDVVEDVEQQAQLHLLDPGDDLPHAGLRRVAQLRAEHDLRASGGQRQGAGPHVPAVRAVGVSPCRPGAEVRDDRLDVHGRRGRRRILLRCAQGILFRRCGVGGSDGGQRYPIGP